MLRRSTLTLQDVIALRQVQDPDASRRRLRRMSRSRCFDVVAAVACHPRTPPGVLDRLSREHGPEIALLVASNPGALPSTLWALRTRHIPGIHHQILTNPSCPPELWKEVLLHGNVHVSDPSFATFINEGLFPDDLLPLAAMHGGTQTRKAVAASGRTPSSLLAAMLENERHKSVLEALAANPRTPVNAAVSAALLS